MCSKYHRESCWCMESRAEGVSEEGIENLNASRLCGLLYEFPAETRLTVHHRLDMNPRAMIRNVECHPPRRVIWTQ